MAEESGTVSFKDTLNFPRTEFPIRARPAIDDPALLARWQEEQLYEKAFKLHEGTEKYILHIGPPYANGHLHLGHAYNGILKDIITKAYRMLGRHVPVKPGWDCHGLPIEIRVVQGNPELTGLELKRACRAYAQKWVDIQRQEFKQLGIVMDWNHPYLTMAPEYEGKVVSAFGTLLGGGFIERKNKTVPWCFVCKTVLATAEIEYSERKDPSLYVLFPVRADQARALFPEIGDEPVSLLVWTTTPWTLPLNRAVLLKTGGEYALVRLGDHLLIMGILTVPTVASLVGQVPQLIKVFTAEQLASVHVQHPFVDNTVPVLFDESVAINEGTAVVHVAPGCGPLDYEVAVKHGLEIYSPISDDGRYTEGIVPVELKGMKVTDAQGWVIARLAESKQLFHKTSIRHSYPHCWRCHTGLIFRATKQWFFNLFHKDIKERAVQATDAITFMPAQGRNFLRATLEHRWEWCLSRQRVWGVPIPALLCTTCDYVYCTPTFVESIARAITSEGVEYWDRVAVADLVREFGVECPDCKTSSFIKEKDILDVWFDAGLSHYAVLYHNPELGFPADLYLEGIDQHRGWFQSSLLTSLVLEDTIPTKAIMTHGFTVDEKGQKMSKSLGNVIAPADIIAQLGTDGLRLWVASVGHEGDAVVSKILLDNVGEVFRKIRNTARFLLSNLYDFNEEQDRVPLAELMAIDRGILAYASLLQHAVIEHYKEGNFTAIFHELADFSTVYLSSWYLDIVKDRLYVEKANGHLRRSAQTACWHLLDMLTHLMAPIMSFTAEQLSDLYQRNKTQSIHLQTFAAIPGVDQVTWKNVSDADFVEQWNILRQLRSAVLKSIELVREKGLIKHPLEARVTIYPASSMKGYDLFQTFMKELAHTGQSAEAFFKEFFVVSQVVVAQSSDGLSESTYKDWYVLVERARGNKCPRCWNWYEEVFVQGLCHRCKPIVDALSSSS